MKNILFCTNLSCSSLNDDAPEINATLNDVPLEYFNRTS